MATSARAGFAEVAFAVQSRKPEHGCPRGRIPHHLPPRRPLPGPACRDDARFRRVPHTVLAAVALVCVVLLLEPRPPCSTAPSPRATPASPSCWSKDPPPPVKPKSRPPKPTEAVKPEDARAPMLPKAPPAQRRPVPEARKPQPNRAPGEVDAARRKAAGVGLLAMKDELGAPA